MKSRNEAFGRLLKAGIASIAGCEGRTAAVVEEELGAMVGVSADTIQRYKSGAVPPGDQAVRALAEAGVRRGLLGREWLQRFLHAARYPFAERLLDELCPAPQIRPRPPRVYENLPAPTYSQFVMREQAFAAVADGLGKRTAVVLIVGLGGNGKTSLAREVAACCLRDERATPRFDAVVWVSDKDRPGTTNLSVVLDELARTLDYPGCTQFEYEEKRREVEQLLRRQRVLLVVDNFETITDGALLTWLLNLPEPSKALITSREKHRGLWSSWLVELRGMTEAEAWELISERARVLNSAWLIGERADLEPLLAATGGNPKALTMTLGLLKYERRPLQELVDDLYAARGDLFDDLFARAWALLDEAARRVLLVATCFPASVSAEALQATADVQGFAFDRAVERLSDMALLDVQQADLRSPPSYVQHPLVRAFARARLSAQPEIEAGARERWVAHLSGRLAAVPAERYATKLEIMEQHSATIQAFLRRAYEQQDWPQYLRLYQAGDLFLNIVPLHHERFDYLRWAAEAAEALDQRAAQILLLLQIARLYVYYREREPARQAYERAQRLAQQAQLAPEADQRVARRLGTTQVLLLIYTDQVSAACALIDELSPRAQTAKHVSELRYYRALCLHKLGDDAAARPILIELLAQPEQRIGWMTLCRACTTLAEIYLAAGDAAAAAPVVERNSAIALAMRDRYQIARVRKNQGALLRLGGDLPAARAALSEAIDLFERLGIRRELAEARQALAGLDAPARPTRRPEQS